MTQTNKTKEAAEAFRRDPNFKRIQRGTKPTAPAPKDGTTKKGGSK